MKKLFVLEILSKIRWMQMGLIFKTHIWLMDAKREMGIYTKAIHGLTMTVL